MFVFLALSTNDRLTGFAMATKACRAAIAIPEAIKFDEKRICVKKT